MTEDLYKMCITHSVGFSTVFSARVSLSVHRWVFYFLRYIHSHISMKTVIWPSLIVLSVWGALFIGTWLSTPGKWSQDYLAVATARPSECGTAWKCSRTHCSNNDPPPPTPLQRTNVLPSPHKTLQKQKTKTHKCAFFSDISYERFQHVIVIHSV